MKRILEWVGCRDISAEWVVPLRIWTKFFCIKSYCSFLVEEYLINIDCATDFFPILMADNAVNTRKFSLIASVKIYNAQTKSNIFFHSPQYRSAL